MFVLEPIIKNRVRILRPSEFFILREGAVERSGDIDNQTKLDALTFIGSRYIEAQRIQKNPQWFDGNFINLPTEATKQGRQNMNENFKRKHEITERSIHLCSRAKTITPYFLNKCSPLPTNVGWNNNLKRWAEYRDLNSAGLSAKTHRKTLESWLAVTYPHLLDHIFLSQGHDRLTALKHYLNLPFTDQEKVEKPPVDAAKEEEKTKIVAAEKTHINRRRALHQITHA